MMDLVFDIGFYAVVVGALLIVPAGVLLIWGLIWSDRDTGKYLIAPTHVVCDDCGEPIPLRRVDAHRQRHLGGQTPAEMPAEATPPTSMSGSARPEIPTPERFIAHSSWRFADTMATIPHEYTVKETGDGRGTAQSADAFDWFARHVYEHGERGQFRDFPPQTYLTIGPYYYWTMGEPGADTTVINRALFSDHDKLPRENRSRILRRARMFLQSVEADEAWNS